MSFQLTLKKTDFTAAAFERSLAAELSSRGSDLPLAEFCEQGGTPTNIILNLHDVKVKTSVIDAQLEVIFEERFPLGCSNALQQRPRRAKFDITVDRRSATCRFDPIDDPVPDL